MSKAKRKIYVYAGPGVSQESLFQTMSKLDLLLNNHYSIGTISPKQIIESSWENETTLLVIPGGADLPYTRSLNGDGNKKIRSYVEQGGTFLGICAGSYY